jgi:NADPH:quinone reductase-like Zn-dependent oxidoreductase
MKAMVLRKIVSLDREAEPLVLEDRPLPTAGPGEVLIRVSACGVCHTELDEIEGRATPPSLPVVPGHEIVGSVVVTGAGVSTPRPSAPRGAMQTAATPSTRRPLRRTRTRSPGVSLPNELRRCFVPEPSVIAH